MMPPVVTMPGKLGDAVMALAAVREIVKMHGGQRANVVTSCYCAPLVDLLKTRSYIGEVTIDEKYEAIADAPGMQPWRMDVPARWAGYDVYHLGIRRWPSDGERIAEMIAHEYGLDVTPGPWLDPRARRDEAGPTIMHAPVTAADVESWWTEYNAMVWSERARRELVIIGTRDECDWYRRRCYEQVAPLREVRTMGEVEAACEGAGRFVGVASAPAVVAAGLGIPGEWLLRPTVDERWIPRGCDVTVHRA